MANWRTSFGYNPELMPSKGRLKVKRGADDPEKWSETILPGNADAGRIEPEISRRSVYFLALISLAAMAVLTARLFSLQIVDGARNLGLAEGNRIRHKINRPPRGVIYDRDRKVLAANVASFDVTVTPSLLPPEQDAREQVYRQLGEIIGLPPAEIKEKAEKKELNKLQAHLVAANIEREKALLLDQHLPELAGFHLDTNPVREYKDEGLLAHFLGYTGRVGPEDIKRDKSYQPTDYTGKLGVEKQYEDILRGVSGSEQTEVDSQGNPVKVLATKPSIPGNNLILSIDFELQKKLAESIQKQLDASGSNRGAGVALDPRNGEVLAAVSLPGYDNNLFAKGISPDDYKRLTEDKAQPLFNKVIGGAYPTGSIIKPLVASAALQENVVTPYTSVEDTGSLEITHRYDPSIKYIFRSYEAGGLGVVDLTRAIKLSSNVYFYTIGGGFGSIKGLGVNRLVDYYHRFGLGKPTGIDVPGETGGRVPTPEWKQKATGETWYTGDTYNIAVGQGDFLASPLQMAMATAAVANGGRVLQPHLIKEVANGQGEVIRRGETKVLQENFIAPQHLTTVRNAMRQVVTGGTACCLIEEQVPVSVAAKTGTAETDPTGKRKPHAWFSAFAPFDDPRIAMVVLVENSGEGSQFAAPAVRETLTWYFSR